MDLINLPYFEERKSGDTSDFMGNIQEMNEQVKKSLQQSNVEYKRRVDI